VFLNQAVPAPAATSAAIAHPATISATGEPEAVFLPADAGDSDTDRADALELVVAPLGPVGSVKTSPGPVDGVVAGATGVGTTAEVAGADGGGAVALVGATAGLVVLTGAGLVTGAGGGPGASLLPQIAAYDTIGGSTRSPVAGETAHPSTAPALGLSPPAPTSL
jgi:hypothetical protein